MLYIGTRVDGFAKYPVAYEGNLTPDALIQGIADLTGRDLALENPVITGKGGMSVCFSEHSALFVSPPGEQKEEFHMYRADQLAETLLDSVQKMLQEDFNLEGGEPDVRDISYFLKGNQPLNLPDLGLSWRLAPYQWASATTGGSQAKQRQTRGGKQVAATRFFRCCCFQRWPFVFGRCGEKPQISIFRSASPNARRRTSPEAMITPSGLP